MNFSIRVLEIEDFHRGFFESYSNLTPIVMTEQRFRELFATMQKGKQHTFVAVSPDDVVIGTIMVLIHARFGYGGGKVGYIEDVAVAATHESQGVGRALVTHAVAFAKEQSCYKVMLTCSPENIAFYEKCGFAHCGASMRLNV